MIDVGDIVAVTITNGEVRLVIGDAARKLGRVPNAGLFQSGFISVPNVASEDGEAAQAVYQKDGDEFYCVGFKDNRFRELVGSLQPGDCAVVSNCTSRFLLKREPDTISLYAENEKADGEAMIISHDAKEGVTLIQNGGAFVQLLKDEIVLAVNGGGSIRVSKDGVEIRGNDITAIGQVRLGDMGGGQPPQPIPTNAMAIGPGGPVNIFSTKVFGSN